MNEEWIDYEVTARLLEAHNVELLQRVIDLERAVKRLSRIETAARHYREAVRNLDGAVSAELRLFAILDETE